MYQRVSLSGSVANGRVLLDPLAIDPTATPTMDTAGVPGTGDPADPGSDPPFVAVNAPFDPQSVKDETAAAELVEA
jgi:hypothetical protein